MVFGKCVCLLISFLSFCSICSKESLLIVGFDLLFIMLLLCAVDHVVEVQVTSLKALLNDFWFVRIVLVLWLIYSVFIVFLIGRLDNVVHTTLYSFGLQFSHDWAQPYWAFLRLIYVFLAIPVVLSAVVLVSSFWRQRDGKASTVRLEERLGGRKVQPLRENHVVVSCPSCKKVFSKPLVMLDLRQGKPKLVNVCPYCDHVLGIAESVESEKVHANLNREVVH